MTGHRRHPPARSRAAAALTIEGGTSRKTREKKALAAVQEATRVAASASPRERALVQAIAKRHSANPGAKREALDKAYADATATRRERIGVTCRLSIPLPPITASPASRKHRRAG